MVTSLSEEEIDELKQAFDIFDKNGDGISIDEFEDVMRTF